MRIMIIRDTVCGGVPVFAGDVITATPADARTLIAYRKAVEYTAPIPETAVAPAAPERATKKPATRRRKASK